MKKTTLLLTLALALSNCTPTQAQFQIPYGFSQHSNSPFYTDFDGDGKKDIAMFIFRDNEFSRTHAFLIYLTSSNKNYIVEFCETIAFLIDVQVENDVIQFGYVLRGTGRFAHEYRIRYNHEKRRIQGWCLKLVDLRFRNIET